MAIEIAGISLPRVHRIATREKADFISHRIPGLEGNVVQDIGRHSARLLIEGIFYGARAKEDLEALRDAYKSREPVDFLAEIVGQAYFSQIVLETFEVRQSADEPDQFSYRLTVAEYVPPPQPSAGFEVPDIDSLLELEALDFLDLIQLPDLLSVPDFGDPTVPLQSILDGVGGTLGGLTAPADELAALFGGGPSNQSKAIAKSGSSGGSLFVKLEVNVDDNQILQLIQAQLGKLLSAGQASGSARQQTSGGIGSLQGQISGLLPPDIDRSDILEQGFKAVKGLLPTQATDILGAIPGGLDSLFATLQTGLVERLGGILSSFDALSALGIGINVPIGISDTELHAVPIDVPAPATKSKARPGFKAARDVSVIVDPLTDLLALLPDPLDARALLQLLSDQLNLLPRQSIPVQNLPILDELRDKLATVLGWLNQSNTELSATLAHSLRRLEAYIRQGIYDNSLAPVKTRMETLNTAVDLVSLQSNITAIRDGIASLATQVRNANLETSDQTIATLTAHIGELRVLGAEVLLPWINGDGSRMVSDLSILEDRLEERIADVLLLTIPATDLKVVGMLLEPLNKVLEPAGISAFIGGIHNLFNLVDHLVSQLNLTEIAEAVQQVVDEAVAAVETLQNLLVNVTVEFSMLVNRVEKAISDIGIAALVDELRQVLEGFEKTVAQGLNTLFAPVRQLLLTTFDTINNFVAGFDPRVILQSVLDLIRVLTDLLSDPVLLDTIRRLKGILGGVNNELANFSFRSVTDVVIDGIGVVEDVFDIVARIPMTDSIREEVAKALNAIPETIRPATDAINEGLEEIVENGAMPVLLAIKDKPAELVKEVKKYSPDKYLGTQLSAPYEAFVSELEKLKPTTLMKPVSEGLNEVLDQIREVADPGIVFGPLQAPFNTLYNALDHLNPSELIQPLQDKLTKGVKIITDNLPLDATDAVFNQVQSITAIIKNAVDDAIKVRDAMVAINSRLTGLSTADTQLQQMGGEVVAKLNSVSDFSEISAALNGVEQAIDDIQAEALEQYLFPVMDNVIAQIITLDPQNQLIALVQAQRGFPMAELNALADSPQKTAIKELLAGFDPMSNEFTLPLGGLQDRLDDLQSARSGLVNFFETWQNRYHQPNGPLSRYRQKNLTLPQLKAMLADTVQTQLSATLSPAFRIIEKFQSMLSALLEEIIDLISRLEVQVASLVQVGTALEEMRQAIHDMVNLLNGLDITFIAKEIDDIFAAVKVQLEAINPQNISNLLKTTFDHLLDALDPNTLLGLAELNGRHKTLIDLLKARDPKVLLTKTVQPEFDKILAFLAEFDISELLNTFLQRIEDLKIQLGTELDRTADAYENMVRAVPGDLQAEIGISVTINT